jgi:proteasome lid subunit RPN8/RPN11
MTTPLPWPWLRAQRHAQRDQPSEACGLFAMVNGRELYIPCRNIALDPINEFAIEPLDWAAAEDRGVITAVFHSHPTGLPTPSGADQAACDLLGLPWRIYAPEGDQWATLLPAGWKEPLEGRQWRWAEADCWSLVRDWFMQERNIELRDWSRPSYEDFCANPMFDDCWHDAGFAPVTDELQAGDCILFDDGEGRSGHVGIYLGSNRFLHHESGKLSCVEQYDGPRIAATKVCLRYCLQA